MPTKGRPPLLPHQMAAHGKQPPENPGPVLETQEQPIIREKDRKRFGRPQMPTELFKGNTAPCRARRKIWEEYIAASPWLVRADTPSAVQFVMLWHKFLQEGEHATFLSFDRLYRLQVELGFTPLSRARMNRKNLPVVESTHAREKRKIKLQAERRRKAEGEAAGDEAPERGKTGFDSYV